jgi:hypothetical protein
LKKIKNQRTASAGYWKKIKNQRTASAGYLKKSKIKELPVPVI